MTTETDAEQDARWKAEEEAAHAANIDLNRAMVHKHLREAATALRLADRAAKRLDAADLYDVDFEGHEATYAYARGQIDVGLAALHYIVPTPDKEEAP